LIYPADQFVFGVTRVYVRFVYQGFQNLRQARSIWSLNNNPIVSNTMTWDGGDQGAYVIWMEDARGIARGQWGWEFTNPSGLLASGTFTVGGESGYTNPAWGLAFDPPVNWELTSEEESFVTFTSPDQQRAMAMLVAPASGTLTETVASSLALFEPDHPDLELLTTQPTVMSGATALLQQVRYTDENGNAQRLYMVSAHHADLAYTLWVLGSAQEAPKLQTLLTTVLHSIRFTSE
jgi:hypothetical protein